MIYVPRLIVTTAYPSAGKSRISGHLARNLNFVHLSADEFRKELFRVEDYVCFQKDPDFPSKELEIWEKLYFEKFTNLARGIDVVVDVCGTTNAMREELLNTRIGGLEIPADKYLLHLKVCKDILRTRNIQRGRTNDPVSDWDKYWEDPGQGQNYQLLSYENNTPEQLEGILVDINRKFRKRE